jgi:hypothetical protein
MPDLTRDQHRVCCIAILIGMFAVRPVISSAQSVRTDADSVVLRSADRDLMSLVVEGLARSSTLRDLVHHLERAQVIVYLSRGLLPPATEGRTRLLTAANGWRYLSIDFDWHLANFDLIARLGHELQHATEIADRAEVVDEPSLAALYERIGTKQSSPLSPVVAYETTRALEVGQQIYRELFADDRIMTSARLRLSTARRLK